MVDSLNILAVCVSNNKKIIDPSPCYYSIVFLPVQLVTNRLVRDAVQFDFASILAKAHESATGILQYEQTTKGKANGCHETGHVETSGTADEEAVPPTADGGAAPLTIVGKTERTQAIVDRHFPVGNRIFADKLVIGNVRDHDCVVSSTFFSSSPS
jgi:hypothetical protein